MARRYVYQKEEIGYDDGVGSLLWISANLADNHVWFNASHHPEFVELNANQCRTIGDWLYAAAKKLERK